MVDACFVDANVESEFQTWTFPTMEEEEKAVTSCLRFFISEFETSDLKKTTVWSLVTS